MCEVHTYLRPATDGNRRVCHRLSSGGKAWGLSCALVLGVRAHLWCGEFGACRRLETRELEPLGDVRLALVGVFGTCQPDRVSPPECDRRSVHAVAEYCVVLGRLLQEFCCSGLHCAVGSLVGFWVPLCCCRGCRWNLGLLLSRCFARHCSTSPVTRSFSSQLGSPSCQKRSFRESLEGPTRGTPKISPTHAKLLLRKSLFLLRVGKTERSHRNACAKPQNSPLPTRLVPIWLFFYGEATPKEALYWARKAVRIRHQLPHNQRTLGVIALDHKLWKEAEDAFRKALRLAPRQGLNHFNMGILWLQRGQLQQALSSFRRAAQLKPSLRPQIQQILRQLRSQRRP